MIPLVAILLALFAGAATADIGLVADIDGDYTNGPDTLLADPGDTIQVNIWITGDDSLVAFGVTLGDTSGALVWIEEPESLIYTTPSGWADIPVPQDSLGWLMIQSTDFSHSVPLVLPSKVAEMNFVVAPGESCGTIVFDPEMSGWQNTSFVTGGLGSAETPRLCLTEFTDMPEGGGEGESPSGGGESNDVAGGDVQGEAFSVTISIPSDAILIVYGRSVHDEANAVWSPGDSLRLAGLPISPMRRGQSESRVFPDSLLEQIYGENPYVAGASESLGWREASNRLEVETNAFIVAAESVYALALDTSSDTASADSEVVAFSSPYVEWLLNERPQVNHGLLAFHLRGVLPSMRVDLRPGIAPSRQRNQPEFSIPLPDEDAARGLADMISSVVEKHGYAVISSYGVVVGTNADHREKILRQIQESLAGRTQRGILSEKILEEIVGGGSE